MTTLSRYRDQLGDLGDQAAANVEGLLTMLEAGELSEGEFETAAAQSITTSKAISISLADLVLAGLLTALGGRDVPPLGLGVPADEERLRLAVRTSVEVTEDARVRLGRLSRSEALSGAQGAWGEGLRRHRVRGWTRGTQGRGCPVCAGLANGAVLSTSTPMITHPGCRCIQLPAEMEAR